VQKPGNTKWGGENQGKEGIAGGCSAEERVIERGGTAKGIGHKRIAREWRMASKGSDVKDT